MSVTLVTAFNGKYQSLDYPLHTKCVLIHGRLCKNMSQNLKQAPKNQKPQKWGFFPTFLLKFQLLGRACKIPAPTHVMALSALNCSGRGSR
jgi:hypothetical protein